MRMCESAAGSMMVLHADEQPLNRMCTEYTENMWLTWMCARACTQILSLKIEQTKANWHLYLSQQQMSCNAILNFCVGRHLTHLGDCARKVKNRITSIVRMPYQRNGLNHPILSIRKIPTPCPFKPIVCTVCMPYAVRCTALENEVHNPHTWQWHNNNK